MKQVALQTLVCLIVTTLPLQAQVSRAISGALKAEQQAEHLLVNPQQIAAVSQRAAYSHALSAHFSAMHHTLVAAPAIRRENTVALPLEPRSIPAPLEPAETAVPKTRSWIEQQQRNFKAWQLKREHAKQIAFQQALAALPQLRIEQTFYTDDLSGILIQEHQIHQLPELPLMVRPDYLYRGLSLENDGSSLRRILRYGLRIQDVGQFSNNLLMSLANSPYAAAAVSGSRYTNLAQSPKTALQYAFRKVNQTTDVLPVIVSVTGEQESGPVVRIQHDIMPAQIAEVTALLKINGVPTWCSVKLEGDTFKITPYEVR